MSWDSTGIICPVEKSTITNLKYKPSNCFFKTASCCKQAELHTTTVFCFLCVPQGQSCELNVLKHTSKQTWLQCNSKSWTGVSQWSARPTTTDLNGFKWGLLCSHFSWTFSISPTLFHTIPTLFIKHFKCRHDRYKVLYAHNKNDYEIKTSKCSH